MLDRITVLFNRAVDRLPLSGRSLRTLILLTAAIPAATVTAGILKGAHFTTRFSFAPRSTSMEGGVEQLARNFGVAIGGGDVSEIPAFYAEIVASREVLDRLIETPYVVGGKTVHLSNLLDVRGQSAGQIAERTRIKLNEDVIKTRVSRQSGLVFVSVTTKFAPLSRQIGERILSVLNDLNSTRLVSMGTAERRVAEEMVDSARARLREQSSSLSAYMEENRSLSSPASLQRLEQLRRDVTIAAEEYAATARALQMARLAEARSTPVLTVIDTPKEADVRDPRHSITRAIVGLLLAVAVWLLLYRRDLVGLGRQSTEE